MDPSVLVVEDDAEINELVGAYVQIAGFPYRGASCGQKALADARQRPCSLVILDIMLPDMSGFQVCQRLKEDPATATVPVVFLSAMADPASRERGGSCGAVDYLTKPFDPEQLMETVRRHALK